MACDMTYYRHLRSSTEPVFLNDGLTSGEASSNAALEPKQDETMLEYAMADERFESCCPA